MAYDHRIIDMTGNRINYSCENRRYRTNLRKGFPHNPSSQTLGNVIEHPLVNSGGYSLWLEHVFEIDTTEEMYWLMWYDASGKPTIPLSGVFDKNDLGQMVFQLSKFVP